MNRTKRAREITGTIFAQPNPIYFGQGIVLISWQTNDPGGAEVRVVPGPNEEQLVTRRGKSGQIEIPWIKDSRLYEFRLYGASRLDVALVCVKVRRAIESAPVALDQIAGELNRGNIESGDILFIDSSHTVKMGSDVNYLFLEVLPRLRPGVIVHVHDIFLPFEYRRDWVLDELRFWTEQYLLQSFLAFNSEFEALMANSYLNHYYREDLKAAFPALDAWEGSSFWMYRKPPDINRAKESRTTKLKESHAS